MVVGLAIAGVGPLAFFAWHNKLGDLAKSPQTVEMNLGTTSIVAGGRAKLWFASVDYGTNVEVSCKGQRHMFELGEEASDEVCGIRVRAVKLHELELKGYPALRATFEVTWDAK